MNLDLKTLPIIEAYINALDKAVGLSPATIKDVAEKISGLREKHKIKVHITFDRTDFKCAYCEKQYNDDENKYLDRCNRNRTGTTYITCSCGKKFGMTYDVTGQAVGFDLDPNNLKTKI